MIKIVKRKRKGRFHILLPQVPKSSLGSFPGCIGHPCFFSFPVHFIPGWGWGSGNCKEMPLCLVKPRSGLSVSPGSRCPLTEGQWHSGQLFMGAYPGLGSPDDFCCNCLTGLRKVHLGCGRQFRTVEKTEPVYDYTIYITFVVKLTKHVAFIEPYYGPDSELML